LNCVKLLIETWKLPVDERILTSSIRFFWEDIVNYLLQEKLVTLSNIELNFNSTNITRCLKLATKHSQIRVLKKLVEYGAYTPTCLLCYCQNIELVKWYLSSDIITLDQSNLKEALSSDHPQDLVYYMKYWVNWTKIRLLFIAKYDPESPLHSLPLEVIKHMVHCLKFLV